MAKTVKKRVTMRDVAAQAGVSRSTVSLAYNDPARLAEVTVRKVLHTASAMGYGHEPVAPARRGRAARCLGLLLPQQLDLALENPYLTHLLQGIAQACEREGYALVLVPYPRDELIRAVPDAPVDGYIVMGLERGRSEIEALQQAGIPVVLLDSELSDSVPTIDIDETNAMEEVTRHLLDYGHRRIAIVAFETATEGGYRQWRGPAYRRITGVAAALASVGLTPDSPGITVTEVPCTRRGGATAFRDLWQRNERPTAVITLSDIIAIGLVMAAREAGVIIPDELSVTGFDDVDEAGDIGVGLTTVRQPIRAKGRLAVEALVDEILGGRQMWPGRHTLSTTVLLRASTGPVTTSDTILDADIVREL
ncbi:MAG: substrate-binding domain-containing protein [Propionibacteriaceae bacterium]|nr:substrate-binding domain-containing protein [Propionibacteriaceae bacterium]